MGLVKNKDLPVRRHKGITMSIRGFSLYSRLAAFIAIVFAFTACGGGGGGSDIGFVPDELEVRLTVEKESVPVNTAQASSQPGSPHVSQIAVRVTGSGQPVAESPVTVSFSGPRVGGLITEEDLLSGEGNPQSSVSIETGGDGGARVYFVAGTLSGEANIRVRADRPEDGPVGVGAEASTTISVISTAGPVAALEFTGPFIEAIRANRVESGLAPGETIDFQNGTYSRVISVTANDANGNPVPTNTPIVFRLIDAPLQGYPESGAGTFVIAGFNGNPLEGNFAFGAAGGNFSAQGARVGDRLVLDPDPDGFSFFHAGIRTISELPPNQPDSLLIRTDEEPFRVGADQGASIPYTIGRARVGSVQPIAFTDANGTASTLLTYPFSNLGRTAILVAQTEDFSVSRVFNPGGPVFLGSLEDDGLTLTASTEFLPSNVTDGLVTLCVRDGNQVPLPVQPVQFSTGDTQGASVDVSGLGSSGTLTTGSGGCVTAIVNAQNQFPGSEPIVLTFAVSSIGDEPPEQVQSDVTILAPDSGNLIGNLNCNARTLGLLYLTSTGEPIPNALIFSSDSDWPTGSPNFVFSPPSDGGPDAGTTNDNGAVSVDFTIALPTAEEDDQTLTYEATFETSNADAEFNLECTFTVEGTGPPTDPPLVITTNMLPEAEADTPYQVLLESIGGSTGSANDWTLVFDDGATDLSLTDSGTTSALLSWMNPVTGSYDIVVEVNDGAGQVVKRTFNLVVNP